MSLLWKFDGPLHRNLKQEPTDLGAQSFKNEKAGLLYCKVLQNHSIDSNVVGGKKGQ